MKRTSLIAGLTGVALLLAGCGSTAGTATAGSSTPSSAPAAASSGVVPPPLTSGAGSSAASSAPSSEASSSAPASSEAVGSSSAADSGSADSSAPGTTVGDASGSLDPQSAKWFDTLCTGFGTLSGLSSLGASITGTGDLKAAQKNLVTEFDKIGATFIGTAAALKDLPPPTFTGGPEFAAKIVPALSAFGAVLTDAAKKAAAVDVTKDPAGLATALSTVGTQMTSITSAFGELQNLKVTPQTEAAVKAIPSCAKLGSLGG